MAKPKPIPKALVCSECGLAWDKHVAGRKTDPTPDVCIRLFKAELSKPRNPFAQQSFASTQAGGIMLLS